MLRASFNFRLTPRHTFLSARSKAPEKIDRQMNEDEQPKDNTKSGATFTGPGDPQVNSPRPTTTSPRRQEKTIKKSKISNHQTGPKIYKIEIDNIKRRTLNEMGINNVNELRERLGSCTKTAATILKKKLSSNLRREIIRVRKRLLRNARYQCSMIPPPTAPCGHLVCLRILPRQELQTIQRCSKCTTRPKTHFMYACPDHGHICISCVSSRAIRAEPKRYGRDIKHMKPGWKKYRRVIRAKIKDFSHSQRFLDNLDITRDILDPTIITTSSQKIPKVPINQSFTGDIEQEIDLTPATRDNKSLDAHTPNKIRETIARDRATREFDMHLRRYGDEWNATNPLWDTNDLRQAQLAATRFRHIEQIWTRFETPDQDRFKKRIKQNGISFENYCSNRAKADGRVRRLKFKIDHGWLPKSKTKGPSTHPKAVKQTTTKRDRKTADKRWKEMRKKAMTKASIKTRGPVCPRVALKRSKHQDKDLTHRRTATSTHAHSPKPKTDVRLLILRFPFSFSRLLNLVYLLLL